MREPAGFALVTGAASGIGRATARALAALPVAGLYLTDRDQAPLEALAAELAPLPVRTFAADVTDEAAWDDIEAAIRDGGGIRYAVANAGIADGTPIVETSLADWRRVIAVNLDGVFLTLRAALRTIEEGGGIVAISSVTAQKADVGIGAYAASKAGVAQLVKVAAKEAAPRRVRVNALLPGGVATPLWRSVPWWNKLVASKGSEEAALEAMAINTPMGRFAQADEIAGEVLHLLTSPFTTGATLVSDGGFSL